MALLLCLYARACGTMLSIGFIPRSLKGFTHAWVQFRIAVELRANRQLDQAGDRIVKLYQAPFFNAIAMGL